MRGKKATGTKGGKAKRLCQMSRAGKLNQAKAQWRLSMSLIGYEKTVLWIWLAGKFTYRFLEPEKFAGQELCWTLIITVYVTFLGIYAGRRW